MTDFNFTADDLIACMTFVKQQVDTILTPLFSGRHLVSVHSPWDTQSGLLWAAFVIHYDAGECTNVTMRLFEYEAESDAYLDEQYESDEPTVRATRH